MASATTRERAPGACALQRREVLDEGGEVLRALSQRR